MAFAGNAPFAFFTHAIDGPLLGTINPAISHAIAYAAKLAIPLSTALLAFYGMRIGSGLSTEPAYGFLRLIGKIALVIVLLSTATYDYWIRDVFLTAIPRDMAFLAGGASTGTGAHVYDVLLNRAMVAGLTTWKSMSLLDPMKLLVVLYWIVAMAAVVAGYGIWLLGHIMVVIYLMIGPVFIPMFLFSITAPVFTAWIGVLLSTVVLQALSVALSTILVGVEGAIVTSIATGAGTAMAGLLAAIALFMLCAWFAHKLPAAAAALCGGIHFTPDAIGRATYGAVGSAANAARNGVVGYAGSVTAKTAAARSAPALAPPGPTLSRASATPAMSTP